MNKTAAKKAAAPSRADTFGTTSTPMRRMVDGRKNRPKKPLQDMMTKVRIGLKDEIDNHKRRVSHETGRDVTRGEILDLMLAAYEAQHQKIDFTAALTTISDPVPSPRDKAHDRNHALTVFATSHVKIGFEQLAEERGWTLSDVVEHLLVHYYETKK